MKEIIAQNTLEQRIFVIRGHKVMVDRDLAELYGVETKYLNRQVRNNIKRFPEEFMFKLTLEEKSELVTFCHRFNTLKHSSSFPHVFTEHGVTMLASILNSEQAIKMSILIVKAFIKLREIVSGHKEIVFKLKELEGRINKHDTDIQAIIQALKQLLGSPKSEERRITGFRSE